MKTLISFIKASAALLIIVGILAPAALTAQNPKPGFIPDARGEYCIPFSDCSYGDGFENFAILDIDNYFSGCSDEGYGDYTWMNTLLNAGESYSLYAETSYDGDYFCVWIDYNDDFEFTPDELIVEDAYLEFGGQLYQVEVTIAEDALPGTHRMRAKAVWDNSASDPCANDFDGETEDYTVQIMGDSGFTDIGIVSIDIPEILSPGSVYPKVTLQNFGSVTFTQLISIINNVDYGTSAFVYDMLPGEVRQIAFGEWDAQIGDYTFQSYLSFADDNPDNNQLLKDVVVEIPDVEPPQNLVATLNGNTAILNWDAPAGKEIFGYHVYNNGNRIANSLSQTTFVDLCLKNGNYSYTVTAIYAVGESPQSEAAEVSADLCELTVLEEGFEAYNSEQQLVVQAQALGIDYWHCWGQPAGSEEDPYLASSPVYEGNLSMKIEGLNDVILDLDKLTEGKYDVNFQIYVPEGFDGFFGIWKKVNEYAGLDVYFNEDETGWGIVTNADWESFSYGADEWNNVHVVIDLDHDWAKLYINETMINQAQWSLTESGEQGPLMLDAIDFYAGTMWGGTPRSFVDAIIIKRIIDEPLPPENLMAEVNENSVILSWDAPMEGNIVYSILRDGGEIATTNALTFNDEGLSPGEYLYEIAADYGQCQSLPSASATATVYPTQIINIPAGWFGLSGCIDPTNPTITNIFQEIVDDLIIIQSENGMYWPGQNINTLINWDSHGGYKIKAFQNISLTLRGPWLANKTLQLAEGWNLIPVLSECDVNIADLFTGQEVIVIKEIAGNKIYWPEYDIHSLEFLQSGKAYYIMMEEAGSIDFPECSLISRDGH
ncbi:MAG: fibronectin type III domain-containing protein [Clostridia bacterium]|nr:fibronectin type III domain-containing protein [Clostridia bacterium]